MSATNSAIERVERITARARESSQLPSSRTSVPGAWDAAVGILRGALGGLIIWIVLLGIVVLIA